MYIGHDVLNSELSSKFKTKISKCSSYTEISNYVENMSRNLKTALKYQEIGKIC